MQTVHLAIVIIIANFEIPLKNRQKKKSPKDTVPIVSNTLYFSLLGNIEVFDIDFGEAVLFFKFGRSLFLTG
jgi:hypothetical protein